MRVLGLELSSPVGSIAFCDAEGARNLRTFPADRKDSSPFYEHLGELYEGGAKPDVIVVGLGPGSYAGVRIALATALGLKAASGGQLLGWPSICAIERAEYFFVGDARRNSFFFAHVAGGRCLEGPTLGSEKEVADRLRETGSLPIIATQPLPQFGEVMVEIPSALRLVELAPQIDREKQGALEPIYLREPYITTPRK